MLFEASGNERALRGAFDALRPRGIIVQVGLGGEMTLPINTIVAKEFDLRGAFRFHEEFGDRGRAAQQGPGRPEAADLGDAALPRRGPRLRAGRRPLAGDEGAAGLRLSNRRHGQKRFDVAALGEAMVEFNQTRPGEPQYLQGFGGDTSNAVIAAARAGARTAYLTRLGQDTFGDALEALVAAEGRGHKRRRTRRRGADRHLLRDPRPQRPRVQLPPRGLRGAPA